jgi:hypothetical protein
MQGLYINVFNPEVWNHIIRIVEKEWPWEWETKLEAAKFQVGWIRNKLEPLKDRIDEKEFFIVEEKPYQFVNTLVLWRRYYRL